MFIYKLKHDKRGMTLIEMIISLVILSILMTSTLGMITSSMSIFTSTTVAALDRMVGNSVYQTLENSLKYATHLTISETADATRTSQSFYVKVTDPDTNSGDLQYRAEGDSYLSLYNSEFYGNRTIQYSVEEVGSDNRHVKITVKIFREGKVVYTKDAVIKCINLAIVSGADDNSIDNKVTSANAVNQYLYFSVDEMLISGGSDAWALEYKINDYMRGYNKILSEYYGKLNAAEGPITEAARKYSGGNSMSASAFNSMVAIRDKAIFGDGTTNYAWEGNDPANYNNLWAHYQEVMKDYLHFKPDNAWEGTRLDPATNPYYGVVATKEELYLGFMLEYYDDNNDGSISKEEYPTFTDSNTFFSGTVMSNYIDDDNKMAIMARFDDGLNENYAGLFVPGSTKVNVHDDNPDTSHVGSKKGGNQRVTTLQEYFELGGYFYLSNDKSVMSRTFRSDRYYKYNGDGSTSILGTFEESTTKLDGYMSYSETIAGIKARMNTNDDEGYDSEGFGPYKTVNLHAYNEADYNPNWPATKLTSINRNFEYNNKSYTEIILKVYDGVVEDYYYYIDNVNGVESYHIFYLEADYNAKISTTRPEQVVATYKDDGVDSETGETIYESRIMLYIDNSTGLLYGYNYTRDAWEVIIDNPTPTYAKSYTFTNHQYKDWIMYGVDWASWFKPVNGGILDKLIGNIASWFTGQSAINSINADNAEMSLGLHSQYNAQNLNSDIRSYNVAWIVYNQRRSTWYYVPDSSNRLNSAISGISWSSFTNAPTPLDVEAWGNSTKMINDIESRKLSSSGLFGLIDTTSDYIWVPLPHSTKVNPNLAGTF